ncbi:MAG: HAD-IA family hydrolase [Pseudomonadota bacterium]
MIHLPNQTPLAGLFMGSISALIDTSEMQRHAFNAAFAEAGLDWEWKRDEYREMLSVSGGRNRISDMARARGQDVDAKALHARKTEILQSMLMDDATVRPGVQETLSFAKKNGAAVAFVSGTNAQTVRIVSEIVTQKTGIAFDLVTSDADGHTPKPAPDLYLHALQSLNLAAAQVLVVEDNEPGVAAATAAGLSTVAFPNSNTRDGDFQDALARVTGRLDDGLADVFGMDTTDRTASRVA